MTSVRIRDTIDAPMPDARIAVMPGGIVVAVDGSVESVAAVSAAKSISASMRSPVHVISVLPAFPSYHLDPGSDPSPTEVEALRIQLREVALLDLLAGADAGEDWTHEVLVGRPARVIADVAASRRARLLMVGRRHHSIMERIAGSETTFQVMRVSTVPVLAIANDPGTIETVVVATDFSPASEHAARTALGIMGNRGKVYLAYAEPPADFLPDGFSRPDDQGNPSDVVGWFRRLTESLDVPAGIIVEPVLLHGKVVPAILELAERTGASMIAAGSHGHTRLERFLLGSVSTGLVRNAPIAVLIAPL